MSYNDEEGSQTSLDLLQYWQVELFLFEKPCYQGFKLRSEAGQRCSSSFLGLQTHCTCK